MSAFCIRGPSYDLRRMSADALIEQLPRWLRPTQSAVNLGAVRIIGCAAAIYWSRPDELIKRATLDAPRIAPSLSGDLLLALPRSWAVVVVATAALTVSLVCGLIGWHARPALAIASVLTWYVAGLTQSFGKVDHNHHLLWVLIILAASPCSDALSVHARGRPRPADDPVYGFPVRAIWLLIGIAYFSAGFWKVGSIGADWVFSDNLRNIIWGERLARGGYEPLIDISTSPLLYRSGAAIAVLFELFFVFLVFTRARPYAVLTGFLFHMSTWATMGIGFLSLVVLYGVFFDWTGFVVRFRIAWRRLLPSKCPIPAVGGRGSHIGPASVAVSLALVFLVAIAAGGRELNGWPVASYPDFGYRASEEQSMVSLRSDGEQVMIPGLSAIEQVRLLRSARADSSASSELRTTIERDLCRSMSGGRTFAIRVQRFLVSDAGLVPRASPPDVVVAQCPPSTQR